MKYLKLFTDFAAKMEYLSDAERGRLFTAMLEYAETGIAPELKGNERFIFSAVKTDIDAQRQVYDNVCERNKQNITSRYQTLPEDTKSTSRSVSYEEKKRKDKIRQEKTRKDKTTIYAASAALNDAIETFIEFRKKIKKPMTDRAVELLLKELNKLSDSEEEQIEILNQSILNGWQGVFALKKGGEGYGHVKSAGTAGKEAGGEWNIHYDV